MIILVVLIIFIFVAGIILTLLKALKNTKNDAERLPLKRKKLLSSAELNFYHVLKSIIPEDREITCKCRLEDIAAVENCPEREAFRARIKSRHVDFVIYNPENGYTDYAIELDDRSHDTEKQKKADAFKDKVFETIGMPLIRIPAKRSYQIEEIRTIIETKINQVR